MSIREQDDLPYRSPLVSRKQATTAIPNEQNYDILVVVRGILSDSVEGLYKDFNAFDILKDKDNVRAAKNMLRQVEAKQMAFDILSPVLEAIDSAVKTIDLKRGINR